MLRFIKVALQLFYPRVRRVGPPVVRQVRNDPGIPPPSPKPTE